MKIRNLILAGLSGAILIVGISTVLPVQSRPQPADAQQASDKYDGDCTGHETAGRCADKCPADTSEGTYYLQGYDKETGAAICRLEYYHACPYADAQPADGPICKKLEAEQQQPAKTTPPATNPNQCGGGK